MAIVLAIILRIFLMMWTFHPDIKSQHFHAQFLQTGIINIYKFVAEKGSSLPYTDTFNYPPLVYFFMGSWNKIAQILAGPDLLNWLNDWGSQSLFAHQIWLNLLVLKLPYLLPELILIWLLIKLGVNKNWLLFNPVTLYLIYVLGQFDILPAILTVAAYYLFTVKNKLFWPFVLLGLGATFKAYPLLLFPILLMRLTKPKDIVAGLAVMAVCIASSLPFASASLLGRIGLASIDLGFADHISWFWVFYLGTLLLSWWQKKRPDILPEFMSITLGVILLSHYHLQWFLWSWPFLLLGIYKYKLDKVIFLFFVLCIFSLVWLSRDLYAFVGLFTPLNPYLGSSFDLASLLSKVIDVNLLNLLLRAGITVGGANLLYEAWRKR